MRRRLTDHDALPRIEGASGGGDIVPVTHEQVLAVFEQNLGRPRDVLHAALGSLPDERSCACGEGPAVPASNA